MLWPTARGEQNEGAFGRSSVRAGQDEWVRLGWRKGHALRKECLCKGHIESAQEKLSVAWVGGRGQEEKGGSSRKERMSKKTGEVA